MEDNSLVMTTKFHLHIHHTWYQGEIEACCFYVLLVSFPVAIDCSLLETGYWTKELD